MAGEWDGREPSPALREAGGDLWSLILLDRDLVDAVDTADATTQRAIARWAVSRALVRAELHTFYAFARAVRDLHTGERSSGAFDDREEAWKWFFAQKNVPRTFVRDPHGSRDDLLQQAMAMRALFAAVEEDPLRAALDAVYAAATTYGGAYPDLLAEVRESFPELNRPT